MHGATLPILHLAILGPIMFFCVIEIMRSRQRQPVRIQEDLSNRR